MCFAFLGFAFKRYPILTWLVPVYVFPFYWTELVANPSTELKVAKVPLIISIVVSQGISIAVFAVKGQFVRMRFVVC